MAFNVVFYLILTFVIIIKKTFRPSKKQSTSSRVISAACQRLCAETDTCSDDVTADSRMETDCTTHVTSRARVTGRAGDVTTEAPERPRMCASRFPGRDDDDDDDDDDDVLCSPVIPVHSMTVSRLKVSSSVCFYVSLTGMDF